MCLGLSVVTWLNLDFLASFFPSVTHYLKWARARTLREVYEKSCADDASEGNVSDGPTRATLSTADVYHWLESEGHFPRDVKRKISPPPPHRRRVNHVKDAMATFSSTRSEVYCHRCGLHILHHPDHQALGASDATVKPEVVVSGSIATLSGSTACPAFTTEFTLDPVLNVNSLMKMAPTRTTGDSSGAHAQYSWTPESLLAVADPSMVLAIQSLLRAWNLTCIGGTGTSLGSDGTLDSTRSEIEQRLAPAAILSLLVRSMAQRLLSTLR